MALSKVAGYLTRGGGRSLLEVGDVMAGSGGEKK